ncbi:MAG: hypothetical protein SGILL_007953 [Bacillariaceae sp.]
MSNCSQKLEKLIATKPEDKRRPKWLMILGFYHKVFNKASLEKVKGFYERAAAEGLDGEAFYQIATLYEDKKDYANTIAYLEKADACGDPLAPFRLSMYYMNGGFTKQQKRNRKVDRKKGFEYLKRSAELGYPEACMQLGNYYGSGTGCAVNWKSCVKWLRRSAELGDADGMKAMCQLYKFGKPGILEIDVEKSMFWLEQHVAQKEKNDRKKAWEFMR